jgi:phosphoglycolate phosphatase
VGLLENEVYAGIPEALAALAQMDHDLVLATSKPAVYPERILGHFGLRRYFRAAYGSELDGARSDKAELLSHILSSESLDPSGTVMVGDREHDMRGAAANAIRGIGVLWGYGTREELTASGAAACTARPNELVSAVETLRRASLPR